MDSESLKAYRDANRRYEQGARRKNQEFGFELITPKAAAKLFRITPTGVRDAIRNDRVHVPYRVSASLAGRTINLINLRSALDCWSARLPDDLEHRLEEMRRDCMTLGIDNGLCYNVLHTTPLVTFTGELE